MVVADLDVDGINHQKWVFVCKWSVFESLNNRIKLFAQVWDHGFWKWIATKFFGYVFYFSCRDTDDHHLNSRKDKGLLTALISSKHGGAEITISVPWNAKCKGTHPCGKFSVPKAVAIGCTVIRPFIRLCTKLLGRLSYQNLIKYFFK